MKRALFFWGGWEGHEPKACTELIADRVRERGFEAVVRDSLEALDDAAALKGFDVIVPCWTMGEISHERVQRLSEAICSGVGLAGWHGGMGDAFRVSSDYQFMVGGQFVAHPGNIIDYRVEITRPNHPIVDGVTAGGESVFPVHSEQYYMHVDPANEVLATTTFTGEHAPWLAGVKMPVVWTRAHGKGRVAYCSIGHGVADLGAPPVAEIVTRCVLWAGGALA